MEIERKFLVNSDDFLKEATQVYDIRQGYLRSPDATIRVRTRNDEAFLTIKGASDSRGLMREEWEYPIPYSDALELLKLCKNNYIQKKRYLVPMDGFTWEVDVFEEELEGFTLAEIELSTPNEDYPRPHWIGKEVTGDKRYYNAQMAKMKAKDINLNKE